MDVQYHVGRVVTYRRVWMCVHVIEKLIRSLHRLFCGARLLAGKLVEGVCNCWIAGSPVEQKTATYLLDAMYLFLVEGGETCLLARFLVISARTCEGQANMDNVVVSLMEDGCIFAIV